MDDYKYSISLDTKLIGEKEIAKAQKHLSMMDAKVRALSKGYVSATNKLKSSSKVMSSSISSVKDVTKMTNTEFKNYSARLKYISNLSKAKIFKTQIENTREHAREIRRTNRQLDLYKQKLKETQIAGEVKTKAMKKGTEAEVKRQEKLWQAHKKAGDEYAKQTKVETRKNEIWKKGASTQNYVNKLLKTSGDEYARLTSRITETGDAQNIANDISKRGYKTLTPQLKKELAQRVKSIEAIRKSGVTIDANTKKQHEAIMQLNGSLKKHHTAWGKASAGISKGFGMIKKAGMAFLTVLGPLFLVGAALRTLKSATDWVYQPFIKFEDALYELRKTANLTNEAMLEIGDAINDLSKVTPIAADELAKIAATAGRLGVRGREDILEFTKTIAMMSVATTLSADDAAKALAKIRQAFGLPIEAVEKLGSVLNQLENTTASTVEELVEGMRNIGASGKLIGIATDEAAALAATLIEAGMQGSRAGPFSEDTEILTNDGWRLVKDLKIGELLYTLNPQTNEIEIHPNENLIVNAWKGEKMIRIKSKTIDLKITPEHKLWVQPNHWNEYIAMPAENLLPRKIVRFKRDGIWKGEGSSSIVIPSLKYKYHKDANEKQLPTRVLMKYIGLFLAEGNIHKNKKQIYISQNIDSDAWKEMKELHDELEKHGFNYTIQIDKRGNGNGRKLVISNKQLTTFLINLGLDEKSYNKFIPKWIKKLDSELLNDLFYYFWLGDGSKDKRYPNDWKKLTSSSEKLIDDFQEICLKIGYVGIKGKDKGWRFLQIRDNKKLSFGRPSYYLSIQTNKRKLNPQINTRNQTQVNVEKYEGDYVYCPVVKNHIVYVRRNGRPVWCQQTRIRRMLTEIARKSGEITDFMGTQGKEWRRSLERDPMQALMMYLEELSRVESNIEKVTIAHSHFGKVAGFAISTLAENYPSLIKNMETANEEMIWGTSLQREYNIATNKTSAQLQLLTNRAEASRREIGEDWIPTLIIAKETMNMMTEALSKGSKAFNLITGDAAEAGSAIDAMTEEQERLIRIVEEGMEPWQTFFALVLPGLAMIEKRARLGDRMINDFFLHHGKGIPKLIKDYKDWEQASRAAWEEAEHDTEKFTEALELERRKYEMVNPLIKEGADYIKEYADETSVAYSTVERYEEILTREAGAIEYINSEIEDETKREIALAEVKTLSAKARLNLIDTIVDEMDKGGQLNAENYKIYSDLKKYKDEGMKVGDKFINFLDNENKALEYNRMAADSGTQTWHNWNKEMQEAGVHTEDLDSPFEDVFDAMTALNDIGKDVIFTGKEWIIVTKDEADAFYDKNVTIEESIKILDKYTDSTGDALTQDNIFRGDLERLMRTETNLRKIELGLVDARNQLYDSTWDLYDLSKKYISTYSTMYDTWDSILDVEEEATGLSKTLVDGYKGELNIIEQLVKSSVELKNAGLDVAASDAIAEGAAKARAIAESLKAKSFLATSDEEREAYKVAYKYIADYLSLIGQSVKGVEDIETIWNQTSGEIKGTKNTLIDLPIIFETASESVAQIRKELEETTIPEAVIEYFGIDTWKELFPLVEDVMNAITSIEDKKEISITMNDEDFLESFKEAWKPLEEVGLNLNVNVVGEGKDLLEYLKLGGIIKTEASVLPSGEPTSLQFGGEIEKTGVYKLHRGEEVIPRKETNQKDINVTVNFPNMIINRELDINKVRHKIVEVINTELSRKLMR